MSWMVVATADDQATTTQRIFKQGPFISVDLEHDNDTGAVRVIRWTNLREGDAWVEMGGERVTLTPGVNEEMPAPAGWNIGLPVGAGY